MWPGAHLDLVVFQSYCHPKFSASVTLDFNTRRSGSGGEAEDASRPRLTRLTRLTGELEPPARPRCPRRAGAWRLGAPRYHVSAFQSAVSEDSQVGVPVVPVLWRARRRRGPRGGRRRR